MIKLEEGKYYRTADGRKVGPLLSVQDNFADWASPNPYYKTVTTDPRASASRRIVAEWESCDELIGETVDLSNDLSGYDLSDYVEPISASIDGVYQEPKPWRDMTPEEKGALLLAHHEGKVIECFHEGEWVNIYKAPWVAGVAYRVKPEEKRETFHMYWHNQYFGFYQRPFHTHRITFDLVDGEPDCASIKMERIDD